MKEELQTLAARCVVLKANPKQNVARELGTVSQSV